MHGVQCLALIQGLIKIQYGLLSELLLLVLQYVHGDVHGLTEKMSKIYLTE